MQAARLRLTAAGLATFDEGDTVCCYARQDKLWATDPDGNRWEVYVLLDDMLDERRGRASLRRGRRGRGRSAVLRGDAGLLRVRRPGRESAMKTILFVCVHNAGRSQMAEAFVNALARSAGCTIRAVSAGTVAGDADQPGRRIRDGGDRDSD